MSENPKVGTSYKRTILYADDQGQVRSYEDTAECWYASHAIAFIGSHDPIWVPERAGPFHGVHVVLINKDDFPVSANWPNHPIQYITYETIES